MTDPEAGWQLVTRRRGERRDLVDDHLRFGLEDRLTHRSIVEPSINAGRAPSASMTEKFSVRWVLAVTWWPRSTSASTRGRPKTPVPPATKIRTVVSLV
jgi:hypothetical protein